VTKSPYEEEVTMVVSLFKDPPNIAVLEELVRPLAKVSAAWKEEVKDTTPDEVMVISPEMLCQVGEEVALPIKIWAEMGFITLTVPVP
jgi:hypothetical protein